MDYQKLFNSDHLEHLTRQYNLAPSKRYGQNFLIDEDVIEKIIEIAHLQPTDTVVEVGPGFGVLTFALLPKVKKVIAFEIEKKLKPYWEKKIQGEKIQNLEIVWGNALREVQSPPPEADQPRAEKSKVSARGGSALGGQSPYKVVANLPYQITSPVIRMFLESENSPTDMTVMVQKEVGERLAAKPGDMSILAIAAQYYADVEYLFTVPRMAFWPSPKVDSAVVRLTIYGTRNMEHVTRNAKQETENFFKLVKLGFSSPRKKLISNLKSLLNASTKAAVLADFERQGHPADVRAQALSVEDWQRLAAILVI